MRRYKKGERIETAELGKGTVVKVTDDKVLFRWYLVQWDKTPQVLYNCGHNPTVWSPDIFKDISRPEKPRKQCIDLGGDSEGITIQYTKSRRMLNIHGHYDHYVGIEGAEIPLGEFLTRLGVTLKDCEKALSAKDEVTR